MKNFFNGIKNYFKEFGTAVAKGDFWTKSSLLIMGMGYFGRGQIIKGILMTLIEIGVILFTALFSLPYLAKFGTLGTVQREEVFDAATMTKTVNDYDNSLLILLFSVVGILVLVAFVLLYIKDFQVSLISEDCFAFFFPCLKAVYRAKNNKMITFSI